MYILCYYFTKRCERFSPIHYTNYCISINHHRCHVDHNKTTLYVCACVRWVFSSAASAASRLEVFKKEAVAREDFAEAAA